MPIKLGKKTFKSFGKAKQSIKRKKGLSDARAAAYVAQVHRYQGIEPASGRRIVPLPRPKKRRTSRKR